MTLSSFRLAIVCALVLSWLVGGPVAPLAAQKSTLPESWSGQIPFRSIGPASMMGRITSIAVYEKDPCIWWAASASGGLLKTVNNGLDFEHQFDDQPVVSIGDVQVSQNNPDLVWVGTGEANPRNSVSWGNGVYKSTDGGKSWKHMGLDKTFQTGRIAIHPQDDHIVFVGALGRLWGPNEQRGLFKTSDGGKTWKKVLYIDDETGVVDVQINPKKPNEMLVATYQRRRDGFDGNDPVRKYGPGAGIYKSVDGGETFTRITEGLPSCDLGRIGLNYFRKNPRFVVAIVESEKIAQEPENAPLVGLRGEDANIGAKIITLTSDGPAEKAGLKVGDIIVTVDGQIIPTYDELLKAIRMHEAGETVRIEVYRDRELISLKLVLGKRPKRKSRNGKPRRRNTPFTGTLGGQAANLQGQQGDDEHEYGGVYLSSDGGDSWKRINTLNPRPMYYSQIRVDPTDRKNIYVLGTSLYRSTDGGETFHGDGGSDGIHVDHHALWIDPRDSRHMILGNDGGIYVTYDRMENWDHHNQMAIGQFYHVGIDTRWNYNVYGGLQDNGSWGGPAHVLNDFGPVNTDWFRVGGGDGFVTLVDPDDPDQIYFESQNGGMGRINLRTGERGFIRPRPPRGVKYRFNWKTPFILSPHNSRIHYSAGNYVFRSFNKGSGIEAISPEITNTDKGAASAISESPRKVGVLYVGTNDGAVWMTQDGGQNWNPLYLSRKDPKQPDVTEPQPKKEASGDEAEQPEKGEQGETGESADEPSGKSSAESSGQAESKQAEEQTEPGAMKTTPPQTKDPLSGTWVGNLVSDRFPEGKAPAITLGLALNDDGTVTGEVELRRGKAKIIEGHFDSETGELKLTIEGKRGKRTVLGTLKEGELNGEIKAEKGRFRIEFKTKRQVDPDGKTHDKGGADGERLPMNAVGLLTGVLVDRPDGDPIAGTWSGVIESDQLPNGRLEFTIELKINDQNELSGEVSSPQGQIEIVEGEYDPKKQKGFWIGEQDDMTFDFEVQVDGKTMTGNVSINNGAMEFDFTANRTAETGPETSPQDEEKGKPEAEARAKPASGQGESESSKSKMKQETEASKSKPADEKESQTDKPKTEPGKPEDATPATSSTPDSTAEAKENDPVSGTWTGTMTSRRGESELTLVVQRKSDSDITGTYETARGEGEITEGSYDPKAKQLVLVADNGRFSLEFAGKVSDESWSGEVDINGGMFSMEFSVKRTSVPEQDADATTADAEPKTDKGALSKLMPGPRWVSSLEASRFKDGRCYITLDGHRSNDDAPYLFVTEDYGKTWQSIRGNLPSSAGSARVLREDLFNENLLFLGCEFGGWVSVDRGTTWTRLKKLPTVAVHEFALHPKTGELVVGTHGRSIWIGDISGLRQFTPENIQRSAVLYKPNTVIRWHRKARRGGTGPRSFIGQNRPNGARIQYSLKGRTSDLLLMFIYDVEGNLIREFSDLPKGEGLHTVDWDLRRGYDQGRFGGAQVPAGAYQVRLIAGNQELKQKLEILRDPTAAEDVRIAEDELDWWESLSDKQDD